MPDDVRAILEVRARGNLIGARMLTGKAGLSTIPQPRKSSQAKYRESGRHAIPEYTYRGQPLPQQDEIFAIENELKRRYQAGDRSAELTRPIPGVSHI